ncbi:MAG: hypothetical protein A2W91_17740 [Bacteroidetes bacterium GWF2_38_335]|nr:MAG: hypothetical protein A2W91_17740 [Bacteroidetes bacterium GWF2_38_335]OFY78023.1 MAG: hypothetical protein A2281_18720 [Bacteroidetes bacterium RIFOXYA12_FULL_38_20]HBS88295.1 hypothetical protein [Bacteroidales bacterium]
MKKIVAILVLFFISGLIFSQTSSYDSRLYVRYSETELENIRNSEPQFLELLTFKLDHSYYFIDIDINTDKTYPLLYEMDYATKKISDVAVDNISVSGFNILKYAIESNPNNRVVYRIGNSGLGLVLYSDKEVMAEFNKN